MQEASVETFSARPYQIELLDAAKKSNTIVCLGTGTGKTFISVMLIKEKQNEIKGTFKERGKRTFFLVCTVPLAYQQRKVIADHTSLKVGYYTGDMGVDFWNKERWISEFDKVDVFVMTVQILVDILTHSIFCLYHINLIIMDECHNATKKHPYVKLMEFFKKYPKSEHPHILGLTASIINEKYTGVNNEQSIKTFLVNRIESLERRLRCRSVTCSDPQATLSFATKPIETVVTFTNGFSVNGFPEFVSIIEFMKCNLEKHFKHFFDLKIKNKAMVSFTVDNLLLEKQRFSVKNACAISADAMKYCKEVLESLGPLCTNWAAQILLKQLENYISNRRLETEAKNVLYQCKEFLEDLVKTYETEAIHVFSSVENVLPIEPLLTSKAASFLRDVLLVEKNYFQDLHSIVFTQRRCTAVVLSKLINYQVEMDATFNGLASEYILGHAFDANISLIDGCMRSAKQNLILTNFKQDKFNVLVATSVVEEGLDVRKCNLVVRFDGINNYREYAQSKGRARANESKFIIMTGIEQKYDTYQQLYVMQEIEKSLFNQCQNRTLPTDEEIQVEMSDSEEEILPTYFSCDKYDAPRITKDNAVSLLYRYCSWLPSDQYCKTTPKFQYKDNYYAECLLPLNCPLPKRIYKSDLMSTRDLAKKSVCMKICKSLHKLGELSSEHLLPTKQLSDDSTSDSDTELKIKKGTRKSCALFHRKVPKILLSDKPFCFGDYDLYAVCILLSERSDRVDVIPLQELLDCKKRLGFGLFMPKQIPKLPTLDLFSRVGKLEVKLVKIPNVKTSDLDINAVIDFHKTVINECCLKLIDGNINFDLNAAKVTKALFVPLNASVFNAIHRNCYEFTFPIVNKSFMKYGENAQNQKESYENWVISKNYGESQKRLYYVTTISKLSTSDFMEGKKTFVQYYQNKYNLKISANKPLLEVAPCSLQCSFVKSGVGSSFKSHKQLRVEKLVPELCKKASLFPADLHMQLQYLPRMIYFYEYYLLALELKDSIAEKINISKSEEKDFSYSRQLKDMLQVKKSVTEDTKSPSVLKILEALTTRQANMGFDLERLENLGDSFLKQAASIFIYFQYPIFHEGKLTSQRKKCVSNKSLCKIGKIVGIQNLICNSQFGTEDSRSENRNPLTVWLPPGYLRFENEDMKQTTYQSVQDKSIADSVEALIGVYFERGGVNLALSFMQKFLGIQTLYSAVKNADVKQSKSCYADYPFFKSADLVSESEHSLYEKNKLDRFEKIISYNFFDKSHLIQALTHLSYLSNDVTKCYQQYEFLGDAILDFLITLHISMNSKNLSPGQLTYFRSALVNNNTFGLLATKYSFFKFIYSSSPELCSAYSAFAGLVVDFEGEISEEYFENPFVICLMGSEEGHQAPKVLGDLFESVAGAIFLDSGLDLNKVWDIYYPMLKPVIEKYMKKLPRHPVVDLTEKYPNAEITFTNKCEEMVTCMVKFGEDCKTEVIGKGQNKRIAKAVACKRALEL